MPKETLVAELINGDNQWKEELIYDHFGKEDVDAIVQILLPRKQNDDKLIWHYDQRGQYLVKSGYQVALKQKHLDFLSCLNFHSNHWNSIWKIAVPKKVKIFLWRAAKDLLPTIENIWKKKGSARGKVPNIQKPNGEYRSCSFGLQDSKESLAKFPFW